MKLKIIVFSLSLFTAACTHKIQMKEPYLSQNKKILLEKCQKTEPLKNGLDKQIVNAALEKIVSYVPQKYGEKKWTLFLEQLRDDKLSFAQAFFKVYKKTPKEIFERIRDKESDPLFSKKNSKLVSKDIGKFRLYYFSPSTAENEIELIEYVINSSFKNASDFLISAEFTDRLNKHLTNLKDEKLNIYLLPGKKIFSKYSEEKIFSDYSYVFDYKNTGTENALQFDLFINYTGIFSFSESITRCLSEILMLSRQVDPSLTRRYRLDEQIQSDFNLIEWGWKNWLFVGLEAWLDEKTNVLYKQGVYNSCDQDIRSYWGRYGIAKYKDIAFSLEHITSVKYNLLGGWKKIYYVELSQSLSGYLISTHNKDVFLKLICAKDWYKNFQENLKESREKVSQDWKETIFGIEDHLKNDPFKKSGGN